MTAPGCFPNSADSWRLSRAFTHRRSSSAWKALLNYILNGFGESPDFLNRRIGVRRDADAVDVLVFDGRHENAMLVEQVLGQVAGLDPSMPTLQIPQDAGSKLL